MTLLNWDALKFVGMCADQVNVDCYLVGGAVRDYLLGKKPNDYDFVCTDSKKLIDRMLQFIDGVRVHEFANYGTFQLRYGDLDLEFVNPRKEIYRTWDHRPQCTPGTIEEDINRRDFTINTLAMKLEGKMNSNTKVIDQTGRGLIHLEAGLLECVSDPIMTFTEDPTRLLRAAVYAAKGFKPTTETMAAIHFLSGQIERIPDETIRKIMDKGIMIDGFIDYLYYMELLIKIIPEFEGVEEITQPVLHHRHDLINHTFAVVRHCPKILNVKWAGLFHDIGKINVWNGYGHYKGHDQESEKITSKIMDRMRFSKKDKRIISHLVGSHMKVILAAVHQNNYGKRALGRFFQRHKGFLLNLKQLAEADIKGAGVHSKQDLEKLDDFFNELYKHVLSIGIMGDESFRLAITGRDIMDVLGIQGQVVGMYKKNMEKLVLRGVYPNTREALLKVLKKMAG